MHNRYVNMYQFLPKKFDPTLINVYTSHKQHYIDSVYAMMAGLYPAKNAKKKAFLESDDLDFSIEYDKENIFMVKLGENNAKDHMIEGYKSQNCFKIKDINKKQFKGKRAQSLMKEFQKDLAIGMYRENMGSFNEPKDVYQAITEYKAVRRMGLKHKESFSPEERDQMNKFQAEYLFQILYADKLNTKLATHGFRTIL